MDGVSSAAALLAVSEACIKVAKLFVQKIRAYRRANHRIAELVIRIEGIWVKTEGQVTTLNEQRDRSNQRLQEFHTECLQTLLSKLSAADAQIKALNDLDDATSGAEVASQLSSLRMSGHSRMDRLKYSMLEGRLKNTVKDLEAWHTIFDPSWFLIMLQQDLQHIPELQTVSNHHGKKTAENVFQAVHTAVTAPHKASKTLILPQDYIGSEEEAIACSNSAISSISSDSSKVIVDTTDYPREVNRKKALEHVRDLARILSSSQSEVLGLLQCNGFLKILDDNGNTSQFQYVFRIPPELTTKPVSLRAFLQERSPSLDVKYHIAQCLTRGVAAVHCGGFVHKNIRPENILTFTQPADEDIRAYLVGFERSRPASAGTNLTGDMFWEKNLYRHPTRQGIKPEEVYVMQHDIYSLGVCLLELGIWFSFVQPLDSPTPCQNAGLDELIAMKNQAKAAWDIKKLFYDKASTLLPSAMGQSFTEVVLSCLTCLDNEADNLFSKGEDLYDEDGVLIGVAFIERILSRLYSVVF